MKKVLLFIASFIFIAAGYSQTTISSSFEYDGAEREYRLYIPASYDGIEPAPLVFNLHGYGSNGQDLISLAPYWKQAAPDAMGEGRESCGGIGGQDFG